MKWAVIGTGNMGQALVAGMVRSGHLDPANIVLYDLDTGKARDVASRTGTRWAATAKEAVAEADHVMLVVKPQVFIHVLQALEPALTADAVLLSVAAGIRLRDMRAVVGPGRGIARVMPNTPALVGAGVTAICFDQVAPACRQPIVAVLEACGLVIEGDEDLVDALGAVASTSPAWAMLFIEALADGAVWAGLPRETAIRAAAASLAGAGRLLLETGMHPAQLKDQVCSPGGTTIEGVRALEKGGFRSSVIEAVVAAVQKSDHMKKHHA